MQILRLRLAGVLGLLLGMSACVTLPPNAPRSKQDPWESFNRGVFRFNDGFDRHVGKPIAKGYVKIVPSPIRTGVHNFFANLDMPTVLINDFLQGKFEPTGEDLGRFVMNTIVGIGGILDPATSAGLDKNQNDFGRTLGVWGLHPGPFLELPILGPSDIRDAFGKVGDTYTKPQQYVSNPWIHYGIYVPDFIDLRATFLPYDETLKNVFDRYAVIRDAYLANRAYLTGQTQPEEPLVDSDAESPGKSPGPARAPAPGGTSPLTTPAPESEKPATETPSPSPALPK